VIVVNQGQILFSFLMLTILKSKLRLREHFEILFVKCVLKPVLNRIRKIHEAAEKAKAEPGQQQQEKVKVDQQLSDQEDQDDDQGNQPIGDPLLHASSYGEKGSKDHVLNHPALKDVAQDVEFELAYNFLVEVLLSLSAEDIGLLFLNYDCQHFSENLITKSLNLVIKYGKHDQKKFTRVFERISNGLA
jgi:hypothetical protein